MYSDKYFLSALKSRGIAVGEVANSRREKLTISFTVEEGA